MDFNSKLLLITVLIVQLISCAAGIGRKNFNFVFTEA